jgi:hypothetical protein
MAKGKKAVPFSHGETHESGGTDPITGVVYDPTTTKGDLIARTSTALARVAVGDSGEVLTADPSATTGVSWQASYARALLLMGG